MGLETLHNLFNRCHKIHELFEKTQTDANVKITSVKRLNTVRWSSREECLKVLDKRADIIMDVLRKVRQDESVDDKHRALANVCVKHFRKKKSLLLLVFLRRSLE